MCELPSRRTPSCSVPDWPFLAPASECHGVPQGPTETVGPAPGWLIRALRLLRLGPGTGRLKLLPRTSIPSRASETNVSMSHCIYQALTKSIFVPTPLWGWRNYILKWVLFVQSILADRYNSRRELWVVSLESPSSVEYGIKKFFSVFASYRQLWRSKILWILDVIQLFFHIFDQIFINFDQVFVNIAKIFWNC